MANRTGPALLLVAVVSVVTNEEGRTSESNRLLNEESDERVTVGLAARAVKHALVSALTNVRTVPLFEIALPVSGVILVVSLGVEERFFYRLHAVKEFVRFVCTANAVTTLA